jgi:hypothetical protein
VGGHGQNPNSTRAPTHLGCICDQASRGDSLSDGERDERFKVGGRAMGGAAYLLVATHMFIGLGNQCTMALEASPMVMVVRGLQVPSPAPQRNVEKS